MSKGSKIRPGTGYSDGFDRIFGKPAQNDKPLCDCKPGNCKVGNYAERCKDWNKRAAKS